MKPKEIKKLIELVEKSNINELEVSRWGRKVRIRKSPDNSSVVMHADPMAVSAPNPVQSTPLVPPPEVSPSQAEELATVPEKSAVNVIEVRSPMVGTFYRAPAPDADPYVQVGDIVTPGQVLCIIEAMKLMNEIESEERGRIVDILVENAQPVEYNQVLFKIEKL